MARPYLCVYGHTALDYIITLELLPEPNTSVDVKEKKRFFGGTGANMASIAARLGVPTALCSFVGGDMPVDFREFMEGKGVDLKELISVEGYETSTVWIVSDHLHNQIAYVYQGPMREMDIFEPRMDGAKKAEVVHICTGRPSYYVKVMSHCRQLKKHISFDPSQEIHHIWNRETFRKALPLCDTFFANENELRIAMEYMGVTRPEELLKTVGLLINTRGSKGSVVYCPDGVYEIPAVAPAKIVDTTGAGDAFRAGFYAGRFRGYSVRECAVLGSSAASFVIESVGSLTNIPAWDAVLERAERVFRRL
ncbi:MAG: carbohydrate kinase family protein [Methanomassiliicoccales archaeon]|jgi:sugar/nucleoside kinase (ribokinase family)